MPRRPEVPGQPALERLEVRVPAELKAMILARGGSAYIRRLVRADHGLVELSPDPRVRPTQQPTSPVTTTDGAKPKPEAELVSVEPVGTQKPTRHLHRMQRVDPTPVRYVRGTPLYKHRCACGLEAVR